MDSNGDPRESGSGHWRTGSILLFGVILTPIAVEVANLIYARWRSILGRSTDARTPVLDWIQLNVEKAYENVGTAVSMHVPGFSWQSSLILPVVAGGIIIAMLFLRRAHRNQL